MKTYTQRSIELGQDINNTWAMLAAEREATEDAFFRSDKEESFTEAFEEMFTIVHTLNEKKRKELEQTIQREQQEAKDEEARKKAELEGDVPPYP